MKKNRFHESKKEIQAYRVSSIATRPFHCEVIKATSFFFIYASVKHICLIYASVKHICFIYASVKHICFIYASVKHYASYMLQ